MRTPISIRFRDRIPSIGRFLRRAVADPRWFSYDLLPVLSQPRERERVAGLIGLWRPRTPGFAPSAPAVEWAAQLREEGITPLLPALDPTVVAEIRDGLDRLACRDPYRPHLGAFPGEAPPSAEINMGYYNLAEVLRTPHVLRLLNDPRLLETAELYLGCKPTIDNIGCWWSYPDRSAAKGTQRYHRDFDCWRGIKVFLYLNDVGPESGAHSFVKYTHRDPRLDAGAAQTDAAIYAVFGQENEVAVTGPAGSWFLVDTYGFHKGALPRSGKRLILTAQYTINASPHLPKPPVLERGPPGLDPFVNRLIIKNRSIV
jgi:hypothetical protein